MGRKPQPIKYYRCYHVDEYGSTPPIPNGMYLKTLPNTDEEILYCAANSFLGWTLSESKPETLEEYEGYGILREIPMEEAPPDVIDVGWFEQEILRTKFYTSIDSVRSVIQSLPSALNINP